MTTEGTYPYAQGGVSTWCDLLVRGLRDVEWQILPLMTGRMHRRHQCPDWVQVLPTIEIWSGPPRGVQPVAGRRAGDRSLLPGELASELLGWNGKIDALCDTLIWCRHNPGRVRAVFRARRGWESFVKALETLLAEQPPGAGDVPDLLLANVSTLYHCLYWVAQTAAVPTPATDVLVVTAAGWAAIPAIVHGALHGTPLVLVEHGVYVREAYLGATKTDPANRFVATRIARGLTRAAYASADIVVPVTEANAEWEEALGVPRERIHPIPNGVEAGRDPQPAPWATRVVSLGRIDPLKDLHTLLRVAAEVTRQIPETEFQHFGTDWPPTDAYGRSCLALHEELRLGSRFQFMGWTPAPKMALRESNLCLMTSISEAFPMSILEAMSEARPVVATGVGGIPHVVKGCGYLAPPGDIHSLATGVVTLLRNPDLAGYLGMRGYMRLSRKYGQATSLGQYHQILLELSGGKPAA
jgi:glycosyltransferase involved in cell wall biosynthesis